MTTLRLLIRGSGLTQEQTATAAGMSPKHLSEVLNGHSSMSAASATALGRVLGVPPAVLLLAQFLERVAQEGEAQPWARSSA